MREQQKAVNSSSASRRRSGIDRLKAWGVRAIVRPRSPSKPRIWLMRAVRWRINRDRTRWVAWMSCCSTDLTLTKCMVGRLAASTMASASLRSFLLLFTNGATYCGLIRRTSIPIAWNCRAQWWAELQASMATIRGVRVRTASINAERDTLPR
ncbi:hypothetical protein D3C72_1733920 [compost metagenome]